MIHEDWVVKGCHLHVGELELGVRPDHRGGIVLRPIFSSADQRDLDAAIRLVMAQLDDPTWRGKLGEAVERAMAFLMGIEGVLRPLARGRLRELKMLSVALERWESR
jgi:hypothetical protein